MNISVYLYGRYKSLAQTRQLTLIIPDNGTIKNVLESFIQKVPQTAKDKDRMMILKNHKFVPRNSSVDKNDLIIISPPLVSGG